MPSPTRTFFVTLATILMLGTPTLSADWLKDIGKHIRKDVEKGIKVVAIGAIIKQIAGPLNDFINTFTMNNGAENRAHTKVVPILTMGQGTVIGAAQVAGTPEALAEVKSVVALETRFADDNRFHIKAYVPNSHPGPIPLSRVQGVGVSAIIEYKL